MPRLEQTIDAVFSDRDITPSDVPQLDLYMDQVLTLFDRTLSESKRAPGDKLLTKTMVNNYVKEGLMTPVRGKKYTREQIMQLLCCHVIDFFCCCYCFYFDHTNPHFLIFLKIVPLYQILSLTTISYLLFAVNHV